jgi:hypothetical protein
MPWLLDQSAGLAGRARRLSAITMRAYRSNVTANLSSALCATALSSMAESLGL